MKKLIGIVAVAAMATALLAQPTPPAQRTRRTPPTPADIAQHQVASLTRLLSLTATQQTTATTIFTDAATAESTVRDGMRTAHQSLEAAVKANDAGGIDAAANTIGGLTAQSTSIHAKAHAALYQILTPEQQAKLSESHGLFFGGFGPGRAGGPGMMRQPGGPGMMRHRDAPPPE
jgi:Spy/CpxP family protein refolding chaperone